MNIRLGTIALAAVLLLSQTANAAPCRKVRGGIRISATGDILVHKALFDIAVSNRKNRFKLLWGELIPTLQDADFTVGNLEGPVAPGIASDQSIQADVGFVNDGYVYSGTNKLFNYHPYLIQDLMGSGFNLVTTANNHSLDRGWRGVNRTIEELQKAGMPFVGTRVSGSEESRSQIVNINGFRIGMISCTEMLNGFEDRKSQVLLCGSSGLPGLVRSLSQQTDGVIVFPHWGDEYNDYPNDTQRAWAKSWVDAGALAIVGNHPHVLQTVEWMTRPNGEKALVIYSLGNFVAAQKDLPRRASAIAHIDLVKSGRGAEIAQFSYTTFARLNGNAHVTLVDENSTAEGRHTVKKLDPPVCQ